MARKIILVCGFLLPFLGISQWGCTDPLASNYNANATLNDGSCVYNTTNYSMNLICNLSDTLLENSGLIREGDKLYTFNDSGSSHKLFELDTNGNILRSIYISGATNIDWEALSSNSTHVFIGDFGNNNGNRQDLCVYRLQKSDLNLDTVIAEKMVFFWSDQTQFTAQPNANNFDCEAFFAQEDSLVLFTKNWGDLKTKMYRLPVFWSDTLMAQLTDSFNVDGLITDACKYPNSNEVFLLGYKNNGNNFYTSFIWNLWDYPSNHCFSGHKRRIEIGNVLTVSQTEGIAMKSAHKGYVSAEKVVSIITIAPKLFEFDFSSYFATASLGELIEGPNYHILYHSSDNSHEIIIDVPFKVCQISDIQGKTMGFINGSNRILTYFHGFVMLTIDGTTTLIYLL